VFVPLPHTAAEVRDAEDAEPASDAGEHGGAEAFRAGELRNSGDRQFRDLRPGAGFRIGSGGVHIEFGYIFLKKTRKKKKKRKSTILGFFKCWASKHGGPVL
jgi:hypothetical protein